MDDLETARRRKQIITQLFDDVEDAIHSAKIEYAEHFKQPDLFTPMALSVLLKVMYENLSRTLVESPRATRSTLLLMMHDLVIEADEEAKERKNG